MKQSICCHLPQRLEKGKKLDPLVIVTQENMQKPKTLYDSWTQILRLNNKFTF